ncbi:MAG: hypothetical protein ABIO70_20955 [Pseudomonadota bacterium]
MDVSRPDGRLPRGVTVQVGSSPPITPRQQPASVCVVGLCASDAPWLSDLYPRALVRETRFRTRSCAVEQVRLRSRDALQGLPGLDGPTPSRVRDAVRLALSSGAEELDVVLARVNGARPWELDHEDVAEILGPALADQLGALLVYPDLGGPVSVAPGEGAAPWERLRRMLDAVRRFSPGWTQHYQVALIDPPAWWELDRPALLHGLLGVDAGLCCWRGGEASLAAHAWRSASAVVAGMLAGDEGTVGAPLDGRSVALPPGRVGARDRRHELDLAGAATGSDPDPGAWVALRLHAVRAVARVEGEPCFRRPVGVWNLPALRAVKTIHMRVVQAADAFTFRPATSSEAMSLANAVAEALHPFVGRGLLVGPHGMGNPEIGSGVVGQPPEPSLQATIAAQLRPWSQAVRVRVTVQPGTQPFLEGA